jgi:glycine hydroxymethyltransferase
LHEASKPAFKKYGAQVVKNAKMLADTLKKGGVTLVGDGTENHLLLIDLTKQFGPGGGAFVEDAMGVAGITLNKNTIPAEPMSPFYPSGIRLGTPALTTRGMKEKDMVKVGKWLIRVINAIEGYKMPTDKEERSVVIKKFRKEVVKNKELLAIQKEIKKFCVKFLLP